MFNFLKDKFKSAISKISKNIEEEGKEEVIEIVEEKPIKEKKTIISRIKEKVQKPKLEPPKPQEEILKEVLEKIEEPKTEFEKEITEEPVKEKKGFFQKVTEVVTTKKITEEQFDKMFWDLEVALLENNVAVEVIDKIKEDLKMDIVNVSIKRSEIENEIKKSLEESMRELLNIKPFNMLEKINSKKPYIICLVGINGSGKTTTIAKLVHLLKKNNKTCVIAAADTFRAGAIQQLQEWGTKINTKVVAHDYGSDPAAVAFDAIEMAKARNIDVVLIDTAGRLHSNVNLMDEMKKIVRVSNPDLKIFIGESTTGNDCIEQAKRFNETIGIDGIILSKADIDDKGGAAISISKVTSKPILYLGMGQGLDDLETFDKKKILKSLGF